MIKKIISHILTMCILFTSVTVLADTSGDLTYTVSGGAITITDCNTTSQKVEIPAEINSVPVKYIGNNAFQGCTTITEVVLPDGIERINLSAFSGCTSLTSINIPATVVNIGSGAFANCRSLEEITIPDSVVQIGPSLFTGCSMLNKVELSSNIKIIQSGTFSGCQSLTELFIPKSVTSISAAAFMNCGISLVRYEGSEEDWNKITIATDRNNTLINATKIYNSSVPFGTCGDSLTYEISAENVLTISGSGDMWQWDNPEDVPWHSQREQISAIALSDEVTSIGKYAFYQFSGLTEINISSSVTRIEENAFGDCIGLKNVFIPVSVTEIGNDAFGGCSEIEFATYEGSEENWNGITVGGGNEYLTDNIRYYSGNSGMCGDELTWELHSDGVLVIKGHGEMYDFENEEDVPWSDIREEITSVEIDRGVNSIGDYAFCYLEKLNEIKFIDGENIVSENEVNTIGNYAFSGCINLADIPELKNLHIIGNNAFADCHILKTISFDVVESIGDDAFRDCYMLESVGGTIDFIGSGAFSDCQRLKEITIPQSMTSIGNNTFDSCTSLKSIHIPDEITSIGNEAFNNCSSLETVSGMHSVEHIGENAFRNCRYMRSFTIPDAVTYIGYGTFFGCSSLSQITIPEGVESIEDEAFSYCESLTTVSIPAKVSYIGNRAFAGCNLDSVSVDSQNKNYVSSGGVLFDIDKTRLMYYPPQKTDEVYNLPDTVETIDEFAFLQCDNLNKIILPDSLNAIGGGAFFECNGITEITIPDTVTEITGGSLFGFCRNLRKVVLGSGITFIPDDTFYGCLNLKEVIMRGKVEAIERGAFAECSSIETINLPESLVYVGESAFEGCSALTGITIPDAVGELGMWAFRGCTSLASVTIGDSVEVLPDWTFEMCRDLTSITLPHSLKAICTGAFEGCDNIKKVSYNGTYAEMSQIENWGADGKIAMKIVKPFCWVSFYDDEGNFLYKAKNTLGEPLFACNVPVDENDDPVKVYSSQEITDESKFDLNKEITENTTLYIKKMNGTKTLVSDSEEMVERKVMYTIKGMHMKEGSIVILALYNNGRFVGVQDAVYYHGDILFTTDIEHTSAKVMVWDNIAGMRPHHRAENVSTQR